MRVLAVMQQQRAALAKTEAQLKELERREATTRAEKHKLEEKEQQQADAQRRTELRRSVAEVRLARHAHDVERLKRMVARREAEVASWRAALEGMVQRGELDPAVKAAISKRAAALLASPATQGAAVSRAPVTMAAPPPPAAPAAPVASGTAEKGPEHREHGRTPQKSSSSLGLNILGRFF
mmetsp:Transcript_8134/g.25555  ORF Transcript_8134/g.25555 Transcript_8134/m.25555 type:complete len:181 (+) Transcript_8134:3-545(+)